MVSSSLYAWDQARERALSGEVDEDEDEDAVAAEVSGCARVRVHALIHIVGP